MHPEQKRIFQSMTPEQKLKVALQLYYSARELKAAGLRFQHPDWRYDERDTLFSRQDLVPGTSRYEEYYARHPENKAADNRFRRKPGLLKAGTSYYDPILFAAAASIFEKVADDSFAISWDTVITGLGSGVLAKPATGNVSYGAEQELVLTAYDQWHVWRNIGDNQYEWIYSYAFGVGHGLW